MALRCEAAATVREGRGRGKSGVLPGEQTLRRVRGTVRKPLLLATLEFPTLLLHKKLLQSSPTGQADARMSEIQI